MSKRFSQSACCESRCGLPLFQKCARSSYRPDLEWILALAARQTSACGAAGSLPIKPTLMQRYFLHNGRVMEQISQWLEVESDE